MKDEHLGKDIEKFMSYKIHDSKLSLGSCNIEGNDILDFSALLHF